MSSAADSDGGLPFGLRTLAAVVGGISLLVILFLAASWGLGLLGSPAESGVPEAAFSFEYTVVDENQTGDDWGVLTITHECGDRVPAMEAYVRGDGFDESAERGAVDVGIDPPPDMVRTGQWNGTASYENRRDDYSDTAVGPGDSVRLYVRSSYVIRVTFEPAEAQAAARLAEDGGPDADWTPDASTSEPPGCDE